jgi:hypothetical protein
MRQPLITEIKTLANFKHLLDINPGLLIIKMGAKWCGPCQKIEQLVFNWIDAMPENVQSVVIDIDDCIELYGFFKRNRLLRGIPAIFAYNQGNTHYIPDDCVLTSDTKEVGLFFQRCLNTANSAVV